MSMPPHDVTIALEAVTLSGTVGVPDEACGLVIFAHGSGSSRLSPRNTYVADVLRKGGVGTLLFDLLTPEEDANYARRFDIDLLAARLVATAHWARQYGPLHQLPIGFFGASTGSAAAMEAAAELGEEISAVVSRGGRPDLAMEALSRVKAPTLLIVGGEDAGVLALNEEAFARLNVTKELVVIPGATHLFEEPGTLEEVARQATAWFQRHFREAREKAERAA